MDGLPPLYSLRAFEAAGRLQSIRRAAEELFVTPGAVSRQVQSLEAYLGVKLFRREPREIVLTADGERYLASIGEHLDGIRHATQLMTGKRTVEIVRVRAYTTFAMKWLIPRLRTFHDADPSVEVRLETSNENVDFDRETIDCAIRLGDERWSGVERDRVLDNVLAPLCSPAFLERNPIDLPDDLSAVRLLHSIVRPDDWRYWLEASGANGVDAYAGDKFASSTLAYQATLEGFGVMMAQKDLFSDDLRTGRLVQPCAFELDRGDFTYYLIYPRDRLRKPAFRRFRTWLLDEMAGGGRGTAAA
ncbi:transcriptional regulator GcvA [Sphingomonas arantia]|uniref:Transcriptional regulator GcvA n=1 Tax=Sphingomonas arantia TaxID=1460676 RepID=A0ABW4U0T2_9SPHN